MSTERGPFIAERLAEKICAFDARSISRKALSQSRDCILDTVGVTLAGIPEDATRILLDTPGVADAPGPALIFGTDRRTSALDATLVNGTASHALDYDDFSGVLGGHQSVPLVPMLFALGEERRVNGRDVLAAYVIGVETEIRLARAVNFHHYDKGWHPTATLGIFGTVAAAARLLRLNKSKTTRAIAIAASLASGLKANFGTMVKPLHVGHSGRSGLFAALLAERGFDSSHNVFEHHQGFLDVFNGPGTYDIERMFAGWGAALEIADPSIALKQFPCCGSAHPAIMMALRLREEEGIRSEQIERIEVMPHGRRLRHTDKPDPRTPLEGKFSVQYVVARALKDGAVRLKDFEDAAVMEPSIRQLLNVTAARAHPDMADDSPDQWGAEVVVMMKDGRRLSRRVENVVGRGGDYPMTSDELWEKFSDCAVRALPREQIAPLFERLETLDTVSDMTQVTRLLEVSSLHSARPAKVVFAKASEQEAPETTWVP